MNVRRVVTGHDDRGKAVFVSDECVAPTTVTLLPGFAFHRLWGGDSTPRFPDDGSMPPFVNYFPPIGGVSLRNVHVAASGHRCAAER